MFLTRLAIYRPLAALMGLLGIVLMGAVSYTYLKVDRLPPISIPFVNVSVAYPQASAEDVEQLIIEPIENALAGIEGVASISSTATEGRGTVNIQMVEGADANAASIEVNRRLASLRARLPADAGEPTVNRGDPNAAPIMNIALTGAPLDQLFEIADGQIAPKLQSVLGVASVNISGGLRREIQVRVDYTRLAAYGLTVQQLQQALTQNNVNAPIGTLQNGGRSLDLRTDARFQSVSELQELVVAQTTGGPIQLKDVASVREAYREQTQFQRMNGMDAVGLSVTKQSGANELQVADDVRHTLDRLKPLLPAGAQVKITNDRSTFTRAALDAIQKDLLLAIALVGAVMLLFLHDWKHTAIVVLAIPTCLVSTFLVMYLLGFTLNIVTLMALALMIGILVDDSIVVLENIHRHLQMGKSPWQAALDGRREIGMAALAITMADVVVYAPIAFLSGIVGQIFRQYALTMVVATLFSLLVSFTLTPMLSSRWLDHDHESRGPLARFGRLWDRGFNQVALVISRAVPVMIRARWAVVLVSVLLVAGAASMLPLRMIATEYAPQEDDSIFQASMQMPNGTSLEVTDRAAREMEALLAAIPEVQDVFTSVSGGGGGGFGGGGGRASFTVQTVPKHNRERSIFEITQEVRGFSRLIPGAQVGANVASPLVGGFGGGGFSVRVQGPELAVVNQVAEQVRTATAGIEGLVDFRSQQQQGTPELHVELDHARMAQLGVTAQQVSNVLRTTLAGSTIGQLRPDGKVQTDITLIASEADRRNFNNLSSIPVAGGTGGNPVVTLGQIATFKYETGPLQIQRVDRNRTVTLSGVVQGRALGDVANDVRPVIQAMPTPPGYQVTMGQQVNQLNSALSALGAALALSLVLEYMLLVALYESWFYPLVRMVSVPLGLVGAFVALFLTGNTLNIFSIIGLIMAEGLVAKNGILLIDYANTLRERGMPRNEALAEAARVRLRPIIMTSATLVFGLLPLAMKLEAGAESRAPTAVVVIGAVLSSTVLTLGAIPAIYTLFDDLQARFNRGRTVRRSIPLPESLQVAVAGVHPDAVQAAPAPAASGSTADESASGGRTAAGGRR